MKNVQYFVLILFVIVIILLSAVSITVFIMSPQEESSCTSCSPPVGVMISGTAIETLLSGNMTYFRQVDPRDIGRAMDISIYEMNDLIRQAESVESVVDSDNSGSGPADSAMNLQTDIVLALQEANRNTPRYSPPKDLGESLPVNVSLIENFAYVPAEWDHTGGSPDHCGNCWVWADTGALQMELFRQKGIRDPLSVQYFNSFYHNGTGIWACCGGSPVFFADFYNITGKAVPLSNMNASFADFAIMCENGESSSVPASTIEISPYYPIEEMHTEMIATNAVYEEEDISKETAIESIKYALISGSAVVIIYTPDDWDSFMEFWKNESESAIFRPESMPGAAGNDGGHVMLILGYNDTAPKDRYWEVLNSWGAPENRPDGIFKLDMDLDYSMQNPDGVNTFEFYVQNVTWGEEVLEL